MHVRLVCFGGVTRLEHGAENKQSRERTTLLRHASTTTTTTDIRAFTLTLARYVRRSGSQRSLLTCLTPKLSDQSHSAPCFTHTQPRFPRKMDDSLVESVFEDGGSDFDVPVKVPTKAVVGNSNDCYFVHLLTLTETQSGSKESRRSQN